MVSRQRSPQELQRLVQEWQRPMYNLAYRMLGNAADAADATQEIFARVLCKLDQHDPDRDFKPWLYRVATNTILNLTRDARLRREREEQLVKKPEATGENDRLEKEELEQIVQEELSRLPRRDRALLVMHYYSGLSQVELAETLAIPRTTVQSRIKNALDSLKGGLKSSGYLSAVPSVEMIMGSSPSLPVPASLASSLLVQTTGAGAGSLALGTGLTAGGLMMSKGMVASVVLVGLLCIGGGYWAGDRIGGSGRELASAERESEEMIPQRQYDELQQELEKVSADLAEMKERLREQEQQLELAQAAAVESLELAKATGDASSVGSSGEIVIDWSKLSSLIASNLDLIIATIVDHDAERHTPADQAKLMSVMTEMMQIAQKARQLSDQPFYDERFLPPFLEALSGETLGLSDGQKAEMQTALDGLMAEYIDPLDLETALPLEAMGARRGILSAFVDSMDGIVSDDQGEQWDKVRRLVPEILAGDLSNYAIALPKDGAPSDAQHNKVVDKWAKAFSLDDGQRGLVRPLADAFMNDSRQLLDRYGQADEPPRQLDDADRARLDQEMLALQVAREREILGLLSPEQREELRGAAPVLIRFNYGGIESANIRRGAPF